MKLCESKLAMASGRCIWARKWLDQDFDKKVFKCSHMGASLQQLWECVFGFSDVLHSVRAHERSFNLIAYCCVAGKHGLKAARA